MRTFRVALAQMNSTVGALNANRDKIIGFIKEAREKKTHLIAFPELAITGYPPEDLLLRPRFVEDNLKCLDDIAAASEDITVIVGFVDRQDDIYNAAAVLKDGKLAAVYHKIYLPNYGVFDEKRYFRSGHEVPVYKIDGVSIGVNICEDIWYPEGPTILQAASGAELIVNINASPYHVGKWDFRRRMIGTRASDGEVYLVFVNLCGGQDELVFDGLSCVFSPEGEVLTSAPLFQEALIYYDLDLTEPFRKRLHDPMGRAQQVNDLAGYENVRPLTISSEFIVRELPPIPGPVKVEPEFPAEVYDALITGTKDYTFKNGFEKAVIGISGGIDSALTAAIAVDSIGAENVTGVFMPSRYTSEESRRDSNAVAENLGIKIITIPIDDIFESILSSLASQFKGMEPNETEENLQARIRGNILMALSNKFGWLVLTTGNKSEMAVGYATLYGDMAGGFALIKDVPKTLVYELAKYRNTLGRVFPDSLFTRPPSAELRPDQTDQDSLPPYEVLDPILKAYVEEDLPPAEIINSGCDEETVKAVIRMVDRSEYKRRQAPPGIKITPRAFGRDRRLPITSGYR